MPRLRWAGDAFDIAADEPALALQKPRASVQTGVPRSQTKKAMSATPADLILTTFSPHVQQLLHLGNNFACFVFYLGQVRWLVLLQSLELLANVVGLRVAEAKLRLIAIPRSRKMT